MAEGGNVSAKMLFGDNMMCYAPQNIVDISEIRDVPDNQEVFTHPLSDQSIIVEILQYVEEPDDEALKTHFSELASSNEATGSDASKILSYNAIPSNQISMQNCQTAYLLQGQQLVSKFNENSKNVVNIYMSLFRMPEKETDILVTMNDPVSISPQSSSHSEDNIANASRWNIDEYQAVVKSLKLLNPEFLG